jgi:DNA-binding MarR family transcriptional regulator
VDDEVKERLDTARRGSAGQLLLQAARLLDERALERVNAASGLRVRPAHTRLFPHLLLDGVRITDLAERVGVTKQAVQPLVAELAGWGVVELVDDPGDGRAKLVRWTPHGIAAMHHGIGVLRGLEDELAERIGRRKVRVLREALAAWVDLLDDQSQTSTDTPSAPGTSSSAPAPPRRKRSKKASV